MTDPKLCEHGSCSIPARINLEGTWVCGAHVGWAMQQLFAAKAGRAAAERTAHEGVATPAPPMTQDEATRHLLDWTKQCLTELFDDVETSEQCWRMATLFMGELSRMMASLGARGVLTHGDCARYSMASVGLSALLKTLTHNPMLNTPMLPKQILHNAEHLLKTTATAEVVMKRKKGPADE